MIASLRAFPASFHPLVDTSYKIEGQWFTAMDSGYDHGFSFNEGVSLMVSCNDQEEIDSVMRNVLTMKKIEIDRLKN